MWNFDMSPQSGVLMASVCWLCVCESSSIQSLLCSKCSIQFVSQSTLCSFSAPAVRPGSGFSSFSLVGRPTRCSLLFLIEFLFWSWQRNIVKCYARFSFSSSNNFPQNHEAVEDGGRPDSWGAHTASHISLLYCHRLVSLQFNTKSKITQP